MAARPAAGGTAVGTDVLTVVGGGTLVNAGGAARTVETGCGAGLAEVAGPLWAPLDSSAQTRSDVAAGTLLLVLLVHYCWSAVSLPAMSCSLAMLVMT